MTMKLWCLGLGLTLSAFSQKPLVAVSGNAPKATAADPDDKMKTGIIIDGKMYLMKFADVNKNVQLNEFYKEDEGPESWTSMVSVAVYMTSATPAEFAKRIEQGLLQDHPDAPHDIAFDSGSNQALFMCLNWAGQDRKTTSEYTVYRFQKHPHGILAYQMSLRPYQAKISDADYKALRERWAKTIQRDNWPQDVILKKR